MLTFFKDIKYDLHILEAMANNRKDGIDTVNENLNQIILHLCKIAIYDDSRDRSVQVDGWETEILNWLDLIDYKCNNLKKQNRLKLKDYLLCLNDDLGRDDLVFRSVRRAKKLMKTDKVTKPNISELRKILWEILEFQFKAMARGGWDDDILLKNPSYKIIRDRK